MFVWNYRMNFRVSVISIIYIQIWTSFSIKISFRMQFPLIHTDMHRIRFCRYRNTVYIMRNIYLLNDFYAFRFSTIKYRKFGNRNAIRIFTTF